MYQMISAFCNSLEERLTLPEPPVLREQILKSNCDLVLFLARKNYLIPAFLVPFVSELKGGWAS